jgi:hypothetical protein
MKICTLVRVDTPYGPRKITGNLQVAIPKELADRLHLRVGDQIHFMHNTELPGTLLLIPVELLTTWLERGVANATGTDDAGR